MSSIDVIVPCYKYGHFLTECVQSVLVQSGVDVRVLIIDDESPDNTIDVATRLAAADPRVRVIRHSVNKGHITTYNEGLEWASAEYVLLLSADDYLLPDALSSSVELMDKHPDVGFTYGKAIIITPAGNDLETVYREQKRGWQISDGRTFIRRSGAFNIVPTPTAVVRTALQKRVGGYRHELPHSGDMEMWLRLAAYGSVGVIDFIKPRIDFTIATCRWLTMMTCRSRSSSQEGGNRLLPRDMQFASRRGGADQDRCDLLGKYGELARPAPLSTTTTMYCRND